MIKRYITIAFYAGYLALVLAVLPEAQTPGQYVALAAGALFWGLTTRSVVQIFQDKKALHEALQPVRPD